MIRIFFLKIYYEQTLTSFLLSSIHIYVSFKQNKLNASIDNLWSKCFPQFERKTKYEIDSNFFFYCKNKQLATSYLIAVKPFLF